MKDVVENEVIKELSKKYNKKEKTIKIMFEKCCDSGYELKESRELIEMFFKGIWLVQNLSKISENNRKY